MRIDLNADVGESYGDHHIGHDEALIPAITSANIAAGFHGGDPSVLRATIRLARQHHVAVGAHPGFPDLAGFGRREMALGAAAVEDLVLYQIAAVAGVAAAEGVRLRHVKPHGALYNLAARDESMARAIARAVAAFDRRLVVFGLPDSWIVKAAALEGLAVAAEGFADRSYERDGTLSPRSREGAVISEPADVVARAVRLATEGQMTAVDGSTLSMRIDTLCIHGDTAGSADLARRIRAGLEAAAVTVRPFTTG